MKIKISKISFMLVLLCLIGVQCENKDEESVEKYSDYVEGYVVGSFIGEEVNAEGQATGNPTKRGYCILLEDSKNEQMDFYTFNLPEILFAFSEEILTPRYNGGNCGPTFFPDNLKYSYKIKFRYVIEDKSDKVKFVTGPCSSMELTFPWRNYDEVIVNETTKKNLITFN